MVVMILIIGSRMIRLVRIFILVLFVGGGGLQWLVLVLLGRISIRMLNMLLMKGMKLSSQSQFDQLRLCRCCMLIIMVMMMKVIEVRVVMVMLMVLLSRKFRFMMIRKYSVIVIDQLRQCRCLIWLLVVNMFSLLNLGRVLLIWVLGGVQGDVFVVVVVVGVVFLLSCVWCVRYFLMMMLQVEYFVLLGCLWLYFGQVMGGRFCVGVFFVIWGL